MPKKPLKPAVERATRLRREISGLRHRYHVLDDPSVTDEVYDSLTRELRELEEQYPQLITSDSPTQRVGGKARKEFKKVRHRSRMYSLNDAFNEEEVREWFRRLQQAVDGDVKPEFYCDPKMDGLALDLVYDAGGSLIRGSTRGDGLFGEKVTENIRTIDDIPSPLRSAPGRELVVRGEAFITKEQFVRINRRLERAGEKSYANPRNLAAGSIRQLDRAVTASRRLSFFSYGIAHVPDDKAYLTKYPRRAAEYAAMRKFGFKTNLEGKIVETIKGVVDFYRAIEKRRERLPYGIDGIVVSINDNEVYEEADYVGKAPRGAVAFKFEPEQATTVVEDIRVQVGRTGAITPVAVLKPVEVGGVTVTHATLHNADEVKRLDVRIGDTVLIGRAGDVIPQVREVLKGLRPKSAKAFHMPMRCPVCKTPIKRDRDGVIVRCVNQECPARHREGLYHFVARPAFEIVGLGAETIDKLVDIGLVRDPADFFLLKTGDLIGLEGFAEISSQNLVEAIAARKRIALPRFLIALGIPQVGEGTARDLSEHFGSLEKIRGASLEELNRVLNIGDVVAESIFGWFRDEEQVILLKKLRDAGVYVERFRRRRQGGKLTGKTFVFTGELTSMTRSEAKARVRALGGTPADSVSSKTNFVVVGTKPGSKAKRAEALDVRRLAEKDFLNMVL